MVNDKHDEARQSADPIVFADFDGTITQLDVTDVILAQLAHPSWQEVEQAWTRGSIGSRECLERQIALVDTSAEELDALVDAVPIDPSFAPFYRFTRERGIPLYVLSEGFDYVIVRILKRAGVNGPVRNGIHMFSSALRLEGRRLIPSFPHSAPPCEHGCATCKAALIRRLGKGKHPVIFVGDGLSDRFAVDEADVVFAKRQLLAYCREHGKACHPFDTFAEVEQAIALLIGPSQSGSALSHHSGSALSQGERVDRDGAFTSRRGPGEGSVAARGRIRQARPKLLNGNE